MMDLFDEKLRKMAAEEEVQVPETLHERLLKAAQPVRRKNRNVVRKAVLLAAAIGILGVVTAGAAYHITREDMGFYAMEKPIKENTPVPTTVADSVKEVIQAEMEPSTAEEFISAIESGDIHIMTDEEVQEMERQQRKYEVLYQEEERQEAAITAAEEAFVDMNLWDADVAGARFEHTQIATDYQRAEALVVLYLSDGCGYRMLMDADTLELVEAVGLTPETMEDEYFDALWNGTVEDFMASQQGEG